MRRHQGPSGDNGTSGGGASILGAILLMVFLLLVTGSIYMSAIGREAEGQPTPTPTPTSGPIDSPIPTDPVELQEYLDAIIRREKYLEGRLEAIREIAGVRTRIITELQTALQATGLNIEMDPLTGNVRLIDTLLFGVSVDTINEEGREYLRLFIPAYLSILLSEENRPYLDHVIIEGHSDDLGTYRSNLDLSHRRAISVAGFLFDNNFHILPGGITADNYLAVSGRSSSQLILDGGVVNRPASRRVEFKFKLKDEELIRRMMAIHEGETP